MKYKAKKSTKTPLSDRIADALTVKPRADIEDDQVFRTKPQTVSRADFSSSDSEDDTTISDFRKRNIDLLSEISKKYEGQVVSRKNKDQSNTNHSYEDSDSEGDFPSLHTKTVSSDDDDSINNSKPSKGNERNVESSSENLSDVESDGYSITKFQKNDSAVEDGSYGEEDDDAGEGYDISQLEEPMKEEFEHVKKQNITEEAKKGAGVRNQLLIWEGLLEMRIHLQRCMNTSNQMPVPDTHEELKKNEEFLEECNITKTNISNVLDKFLTLQNMLFKSFPETKILSSKNQTVEATKAKKEESDEEIPSDTDNEEIPSDTDVEEDVVKKETKPTVKVDKNNATKKRKLEDYEKEIAMSHKTFKTFRDSTIQKWNEKTRLATATNIKQAPTNTVLQQISYIMSDREKLVKRTQLKRSDYNIIGHKKVAQSEDQNGSHLIPVMKDRKDDDEYIPEIFDDSDFYHQLLRELIECKSADISDPVQLSRQWIALQQMRSKMKRKVDTKATKGRKIKYVVHNQLVNYMAPEKCTTWTDEATNELYSSLFGKIFEHNNVGLNASLESGFKLKT